MMILTVYLSFLQDAKVVTIFNMIAVPCFVYQGHSGNTIFSSYFTSFILLGIMTMFACWLIATSCWPFLRACGLKTTLNLRALLHRFYFLPAFTKFSRLVAQCPKCLWCNKLKCFLKHFSPQTVVKGITLSNIFSFYALWQLLNLEVFDYQTCPERHQQIALKNYSQLKKECVGVNNAVQCTHSNHNFPNQYWGYVALVSLMIYV